MRRGNDDDDGRVGAVCNDRIEAAAVDLVEEGNG